MFLFRVFFLLLDTMGVNFNSKIFFQFFLLEEAVFLSSGNVFFNESFIPAIGEGFSFYWKPSILFDSFFLLAETVTDMSETISQ